MANEVCTYPMLALPTTNPFSTTDTTVSYSTKVDIQMEQNAQQVRATESSDWDEETDIENDYE